MPILKTPTPENLITIVSSLRSGEVAALPSETVYGLAGAAFNSTALEKIFLTKKRPYFDPLIVHVGSWDQVDRVAAIIPEAARFLMKIFWPGPLTFVLPKTSAVSDLLTSGLSTVAVRWPAHALFREILVNLGEPLAAPSANRFGRTSPTTAAHVLSEFPEDSFFVLDGGPCEVGLESTVIGIDEGPHEIRLRIFRPGQIGEMELVNALKQMAPNFSVKVFREYGQQVSPGHLKNHYMPDVPLVLLPPQKSAEERQKIFADILKSTSFQTKELFFSSSPQLAARNLYSDLRKLCEEGADLIYLARRTDQIGPEWEAHWDRLKKAATLDLTDSLCE